MAEELASLVAYIGADLGGLERGLTRAEGLLKNAGTKLMDIGKGMTLIGAPIAAGLAVASKAAMDFEDALTDVAVRGKLSKTGMLNLRTEMIKVGRDFKVGATNATRGMQDLVAGGMSVEDALKALPSVIALSKTELVDMGDAADWVTDTMSQFGLEADQAGIAADIVARAAGASSATITDMFQALSNVGPLAKNFGLDLDDTASILGVFANQGIKGAEAGTQLKSMLTQMSSEGGIKALQELGVSLYDKKGNARPLGEVLAELNTALEKLPAEQKNQAIQKIAGSYGQVGLAALLASGGFYAMSTQMDKATSLQDAAEIKSGTLSAKIGALQSGITDLGVKAMGPLNDQFLSPLIDKLGDVVKGAGDWMDKNPEMVTGILGLAGAVLPAGMGLMALGGFIKMAGSAIPLMLNPLGLLIAGVGALAALLQSDFVKQGFEAWKSVVENTGRIISHVATGGMKVANEQEMADYDKQLNRLTYIPDAGMGGMMPGSTPWDIMEVKKPKWQMDKLESDAGGMMGGSPIKAKEKELDESLARMKTKVEDVMGPKGEVITTVDQGMAAFVGAFKSHQDSIAASFGGLTPKLIVPFTDWLKTIGTLLMKVGGVSGLSLIGQVGAGIIGAIAGLSPRATGGMVAAGSGYVVGERGPELFVPDVSGRIVPKVPSGGGGYGNLTLNAYGVSDPVRLVDMIDREMQRRNRK